MASVLVDNANCDWTFDAASRCWREIPAEQIDHMKSKYLQHQHSVWKNISEKKKYGFEFDEEYSKNIDLSAREDYIFRRDSLGILRSVVFKLNDDLGWCDYLAVHYHKRFASIPDEALSSIIGLAPHLSKSLELSRTFDLLEKHYKAVLAALDHVVIGLCLVKGNRQIVIANAEANRIFDDGGVMRINSAGVLISRSMDTSAVLSGLIDKAVNAPRDQAGEYENIVRLEGEDSNSILVEGIHLRDSGAELGEKLECALLTIVDLKNTRSLNVERLSKVYSLTTAESAICAMLIQGLTKNEIAEQRNVSPETVKSQTSSVYRKTNTNNRVDLVRLVLKTSPPVHLTESSG